MLKEKFHEQNCKLQEEQNYNDELDKILYWYLDIEKNSSKREKYNKLIQSWNIDTEIFLTRNFYFLEEKLSDPKIINYIITVAFLGNSGIRVPAVILFYKDKVNVLCQKAKPGLLGVSLKQETISFDFTKCEFRNLDLFTLNGQLCYQFKSNNFSPYYEVIINEKQILARRYSKDIEEKQNSIDENTNVTLSFCPKCGKKLISDMPFCGYCGNKIY